MPPLYLSDSEVEGSTVEDRFVGVTSPTDIECVSIQYTTRQKLDEGALDFEAIDHDGESVLEDVGDIQVILLHPMDFGFEIDHLQYGRLSAEEGALSSMVELPTPYAVPEPSGLLLGAMVAAGLARRRRGACPADA